MPLTRKLLLVLGTLGMADTALLLCISGGINLGTLLPGIAGAALVAWSVYTAHTSFDRPFPSARSPRIVLFSVLILLALSFVGIETVILFHALHGGEPEADWCIVLGAGLRGDRPSRTLQRRIATASDYLNRRPSARVVVSGGKGLNETITEAEAMRRGLAERGIASDRIFLEEQATSTLENLRFSKEIIARAGGNDGGRICAISSDFHLFRVRFLARRLGMDVQTIAAPTPWYLLPNTCLREYFAIVKSILVDR